MSFRPTPTFNKNGAFDNYLQKSRLENREKGT